MHWVNADRGRFVGVAGHTKTRAGEVAFGHGIVVGVILHCDGLHKLQTDTTGGEQVTSEKAPHTFVKGAFNFFMVGRAGVEPTTNGLKVRCSTN